MKILIPFLMVFCCRLSVGMNPEQIAILDAKSSNDNYEWYSAANTMVERVTSKAKQLSAQFIRNDFFIPTECQTESGLVIECNDKIPMAVHMPLGTWKFVYQLGRELNDCCKDEFLQGIEHQEYQGKSHDLLKDAQIKKDMLKLYSVLSVDEVVLPPAKFKEKKDFVSLPQALAQWSELTKLQPSKSGK